MSSALTGHLFVAGPSGCLLQGAAGGVQVHCSLCFRYRPNSMHTRFLLSAQALQPGRISKPFELIKSLWLLHGGNSGVLVM